MIQNSQNYRSRISRARDLKWFFYGYGIDRRLGRVDVPSGGWGWGHRVPVNFLFLPETHFQSSYLKYRCSGQLQVNSPLPVLTPSNLNPAQGQRHDFNQLNPF